MSGPTNPIVLIPSRLASTRLPNKPLADIHGTPMIVHVWRRAMEADLGPVFVAAGDVEIVGAVEAAGGKAILTSPDLPSGSDRIYEALQQVDPDRTYDSIVNVQGDLPTIEGTAVQRAFAPLSNPAVDISTLATIISDPDEVNNPNVVKAIAGFSKNQSICRALYFTRATAPTGDGPLYHHIGLYAYKRDALEKFVKAPPSVLEQREKLEQLRALELGLRIDIALVDTMPLGVDTSADLEKARRMLGAGQV